MDEHMFRQVRTAVSPATKIIRVACCHMKMARFLPGSAKKPISDSIYTCFHNQLSFLLSDFTSFEA